MAKLLHNAEIKFDWGSLLNSERLSSKYSTNISVIVNSKIVTLLQIKEYHKKLSEMRVDYKKLFQG